VNGHPFLLNTGRYGGDCTSRLLTEAKKFFGIHHEQQRIQTTPSQIEKDSKADGPAPWYFS
jgi:hypothetical protein